LDRRRARTARLGALCALAAGAALAQSADAPLRAERWIAPGADRIRALTTEPTECLAPPPRNQALAVEVGRAAFRTPTLLGGQAARAGLACETCHRAGHSNPDFLFPGLSGAAGTADVTSSLMSSHRGNGIDDPRPIPDLSGPRAALKISRAPGDPSLETFVHGLIVEEFDGPEPSPTVMAGLVAYLRALDPAACPPKARRAITAAGLLDDADRAMAAAQTLARQGDVAAAATMVAAARARLGLIDERWRAPEIAPTRARLRRLDDRLALAAEALRRRTPDAVGRLAQWPADSRRLRADLARGSAHSLFDSRRLAMATEGGLPR